MAIAVQLFGEAVATGGNPASSLDVFLSLPADERVEAAVAGEELYSQWSSGQADLAEVAAAFVEALPKGDGAVMLYDLEAQVAPVLVSDSAQMEQSLQSLLAALKDANARSPRLLACRLDGESPAWGDACNCDPQSRSALVIVVRSRPGSPAAADRLGQAEVEYRFARASLEGADAANPVVLQSQGMRQMPMQRGLEMAQRTLKLDTPARLFWIEQGDKMRFWGARGLEGPVDAPIRRKYRLTGRGEELGAGVAIGHGVVAGKVRIPTQPSEVQDGDIVVVDRLEPLWYEDISRAKGIVTRQGGRTSHAALMAADLGIPAIVGCEVPELAAGQEVTLDCEQASRGRVLEGMVDYQVSEISLKNPPDLPVDIMLDMANPYRAFSLTQVPHRGIGLVRQEFIVGQMIGIHPAALLSPERLDNQTRQLIAEKTADYDKPVELFINRLCQGIASLVTAAEGKPVILRLSDFKSDEYSRLIGGKFFEPTEPNPAIGLRGASRYLKHDFRACLELECEAVRRVQKQMGFDNIRLMIPFVRTPEEGAAVLDVLADLGLKRGEDGLQILMMIEVPANLVLADEFSDMFDGFSIGASDLTQLMLGVDRGAPIVSHLFDEGHPALLKALEQALTTWHQAGRYTSVCGRGISSNFPLALWFARQGVNSLTVEPQRAADLWMLLHEELGGGGGS